MKGGVIYRQLAKSNRGKKGERGKGRCISPENMSYLRLGRAGRGRGRRGKCSSHDAKLSPTTPGYFSGTFLPVQAQKELAGGVVSLFPM